MRFIKASEICCYSMTLSYFFGEVIELFEEIKKGNLEGMKLEAWDVYSCFHEYMFHVVGIDMWLIDNPSTKAWARRWGWWERWLRAHGLKFKPEYMQYGSNFKRREKRRRVLEMARKEG